MNLRALLPESERSELALVALLVAIVAMLVVPLPTPLLDVAIACNLGLGIILVASALYVRDVTRFAAFPTVILLATLYRLALNVSSTRLILLQADAGRVIESFGSFVVRGDYLVGALVFVVLTVVQFVVIARGAERVAEVGARFSLDAMPGKQLAIDAEQRAGSLGPEGARAARKALERESQLYGAMDGAMKFVKGDAIAGIVITLVNFLGGAGLGVLSRGLSVEQSFQTYGLLTIGDGLVTQLPALLCATAAGLVVTRVQSDDPDSSLARDLTDQLFGDARVLFAALVLLLVLCAVPGLPAWPFAIAALGCLVLFLRARRLERRPVAQTRLRHGPEALVVEVAPDLAPLEARFRKAHAQATEALERRLGLRLGSLQLRASSALPAGHFRIVWRELPLAPAPAGELEAACAEALLAAAHKHADDLLGLDQVEAMLRSLEREQPALVRLTVPRVVTPTQLAQVLRLLAREGVSVRWLSEILEALAALPSVDASPERLVEHVRRGMARRISQSLAPAGTLHVMRLAPEVDEALSDGLKREGQDEWLALAPDLARDITRAITDAHTRAPRPHALLVDPSLRRHTRTLLAESAPELAVVTAFELTASLELVPLAPVGP